MGAGTIIKPTVGRVVLFTPAKGDTNVAMDGGPCAALVTKVWNDRMVNLAVFDANGQHFAKTSVTLVQEGDRKPDGYFAEWMEYQKGQAQKAEQLERQLAGAGAGTCAGAGNGH